jgi:hypothetical protein
MTKQKPPGRAAPRAKSRRHGYRGYGSPLHKEPGGVIHYPRGFTGVVFPDQGSALPRAPEVVSDELREHLREDSPTKP